MAEHVDQEITDAVIQASIKNLGDAVAHSMATIFQPMAQDINSAMQQAVVSQQQVQNDNMMMMVNALHTMISQDSVRHTLPTQYKRSVDAFAEQVAILQADIEQRQNKVSRSRPHRAGDEIGTP